MQSPPNIIGMSTLHSVKLRQKWNSNSNFTLFSATVEFGNLFEKNPLLLRLEWHLDFYLTKIHYHGFYQCYSCHEGCLNVRFISLFRIKLPKGLSIYCGVNQIHHPWRSWIWDDHPNISRLGVVFKPNSTWAALSSNLI